MRINPSLQSLSNAAQPPLTTNAPQKGGSEDFGQMLMDALKDVNKSEQHATNLQNDLMANRPVEYHDLMIAMERASTSLNLTMQVRNKILDAYTEISRMSV